ncbi:hypothetical protein ACIPF8_12210 [Collimonas sp. NPDC087041]|uniref:hypothetical protein n=1 Tax=Collimonas sp. NPDC087041 TaxID=3363960 RepID=UPI00380FD851
MPSDFLFLARQSGKRICNANRRQRRRPAFGIRPGIVPDSATPQNTSSYIYSVKNLDTPRIMDDYLLNEKSFAQYFHDQLVAIPECETKDNVIKRSGLQA